ncbi:MULTISPECIES: hypothetical protein [Pseudofrankia]|uniref:hypothetical protein n=1 Tax=Pseudofrankia TaxID=2994363 RepID=UPI000234D3F4|nr:MULTISPECIES: hypothetical protein [Pseudofrankia]OHV32451.1 hypothetical protein BCD49_29915 [Pseudofrankia sp. EUN1h]
MSATASSIVSLSKDSVIVATPTGQVALFPGWRGPAAVWVKGRGNAYEWGVFAVSATDVAFASPRGELFRAPRQGTAVSWPWWSGRMIAHLRLPGGQKHAVAFSRPFPEMAGPDPAATRLAIEVLGANGVLPAGGPHALEGTRMYSEIGEAIRGLVDLVAGSRRSKAVRALLASA